MMKKTFKEGARKVAADDLRERYMANACLAMKELCAEGELRGITPLDFAQSVAVAMAARDPELAGEVIEAVRLAVNLHPVTKIIEAKAE